MKSNAPVLSRFLACGVALAATLHGRVAQADWPQFLGPTRDGVYVGTALAATWPKEGPRKEWSREVGAGFSGPVVVGGHVLLFHRTGDEEILEAFDIHNGTPLWKTSTDTHYVDDFGFDEGPRATPAVAAGRVFTFGAEGRATGYDLKTGTKLWSIDCKRSLGARKGFFGLAPSPIVGGNVVIFQPGGEDGAGIVALDALSGDLRWKSGNDEASYASPVIAEFGGKCRLLALTRDALLSLDPATGRSIFRYPWRPPMSASVSAATPLVLGDEVFLSASYGTGAILLKYSDSGPTPVWEQKDALANHYATSVYRDGNFYGFDGRQEQGCNLRCVDAKSGNVRWNESRFGGGTLLIAGTELIILTDKGELVRAPISAEHFKPTARAQIMPFLARAHPALSDGRLYARSKDKLFCFDLSPVKP